MLEAPSTQQDHRTRNRNVVHLIAAARPNFMKVAPLFHALHRVSWCDVALIHTGQHYDANMSGDFFRDLGLPDPEHHLGVGAGSHAEQTGGVMIAYERVCLAERPDWIIVVGDVNSTMACALVGAKLCIPVAHLEAGLRSRDRTMPEEINRIVTDAVASCLWTPSVDADENLRAEGIPAERIEMVGNIMIDSFEMLREAIEARATRGRFDLASKSYAVITLHRPVNVDDRNVLSGLVDEICAAAKSLPVVFPVHPRTKKNLEQFGLLDRLGRERHVHLTEPMGYIDFMGLVREARIIVTDSGGMQEETTYLNIPCLTIRDTTERPITISQGSNRLVNVGAVHAAIERSLADGWPAARRPKYWDGRTAERVVASLKRRVGA